MGSFISFFHGSTEQVINYSDDVQYMSSEEKIEPWSGNGESGVI